MKVLPSWGQVPVSSLQAARGRDGWGGAHLETQWGAVRQCTEELSGPREFSVWTCKRHVAVLAFTVMKTEACPGSLRCPPTWRRLCPVLCASSSQPHLVPRNSYPPLSPIWVSLCQLCQFYLLCKYLL